MKDSELQERLVNMYMHQLMHLPMRMYGFDEDGNQVLIKEVHRREKGCVDCDTVYKDLLVPTPYGLSTE